MYHHAVALATTTYHKKLHKSRDYSGLYGVKLITFRVDYSLLTAYQFLICRDSKSGGHFCSPLWCLSLRTLCVAGSFYLVLVVLLADKRDGLEGIAQVFSYLPGSCAVIMEGHLILLIDVQHQVNLTGIVLRCYVEMITAIEGDVALSGV